ncbi:Signal-induced proliferation-associated 1-like protein 1 [Hypsibius exemplaris]|uniref:Signal-induced proliferation-associated 1-like protein 1 n=1 Tax=Hypsibius exemplaris TaxID=2072580 RepID=A0A1W0WUV8_HYPEX|nr:Signal-induced proliferation-associated 1-like protein 1 [Hypsibius exemplaris]
MSATVVDPHFYYQHMRPEMPPPNAAPSPKDVIRGSARSMGSINPPPYPPQQQPQRDAGSSSTTSSSTASNSSSYVNANRSPRVARHLIPIVRPVYDDRALSNGGGGSQPSSSSSSARFTDAEIIANPMAQQQQPQRRHYYHHRSVSSLDIPMEEDDTPKPTALLKEYGGSASSIDFGKSVGGNIRAILDQLKRGKSASGSANSLSSLPNSDGSGGSAGSNNGGLCNPRSKKAASKDKPQQQQPKKSNLRSRSSIFRKMRGGSSSSNGGLEEGSVNSSHSIEMDTSSADAAADGDRIRRRIFAHYDTGSVMTRLVPSRETLATRRNTTTGASAANFSTRCVLPSADGPVDASNLCGDEVDQGDGKSNNLLLNCPYFRNEISPEDCSPSVSPASSYGVMMRLPHGRRHSNPPTFRPHYGAIILEDEDVALASGTQGPKCIHQLQPRFEHLDNGAFYYRKYFHGEEHSNYFGMDEKFGPVAVSIKKEKCAQQGHKLLYRLVVRTSELPVYRGSILEDAIPRFGKDTIKCKDLLDCLVPELQTSSLRLGLSDLKTEEQLLKLDEQAVPKNYKVGIMYCKAGQCTEEEMYNNETASPSFDEFLDLLGQRVRLKGFEKYRAQLDNKSDSTGPYSLYTAFHGYQVMFHVSTMLPFTPSNKQQLLRKRHIGNDIVTIIFQEPGALPFSPKTIRSHFQHVFIVVRVQNPNTDHAQYHVSVSRSRDVPPFGPPLPETMTFTKGPEFVDFLLTKVINAENAAHKSDKFVALATRTRHEYLKDLALNSVTHSTMESGMGKLTLFSLSSKKREKTVLSFRSDASLRGALIWNVQARDFDPVLPLNGRMILGISDNYVVLIDMISNAVSKIIPNSNIMGWKSQEESLSLYYHVGETVQIICDTADDWKEIMQRLKAVTDGIEVVDVTLSRNGQGHLGFHTQFNGTITDVDPHSYAYKAGLRRGCCLLEICGRSVSLLDHETLADLLRRATPVTVAMLPALEGGVPRRGCSRPVCTKAPEHVLSANYDNLSESLESVPQAVYVQPVGSRSTSSLVDGHVAFFLKSDGTKTSNSISRALPSQPSSPPKRHDSRFQPTLDDLEAESQWWANQMAEETNRLNRIMPEVSDQVPPQLPAVSSHPNLQSYAEYTAASADLRPFRPFERKLSPNSSFPLFDSGTDTMSSTTSKSSSRSQKDNAAKYPASTSPPTRPHVRHHKTDPGFRPPVAIQSSSSRVPVRSSPSKTSLKKNAANRQSANLQEDLLKLINPDLIDSDSLTVEVPADSGFRRASEGVPKVPAVSHFIERPSYSSSMSKSLETVAATSQMNDQVAWNNLVNNAERAAQNASDILYAAPSSESSSTSPDAGMDRARSSPPPVRPRSSSKKHCSRPASGEFQPDRFVSAERIQELEDRITKLIYDLNKEREDRMVLETQVRQLTYDHQRLDDHPRSSSVPFPAVPGSMRMPRGSQ